jgi:hypothetical protein
MKAQVAVEFMVLFAILAFFFIAYIQSGFYMKKDQMSVQEKQEAKSVSDNVAFEINRAVDFGSGYERDFHLDESWAGVANFNITVKDYEVTVTWDESVASSVITVRNITGSVKPGWNNIRNGDGVIYVA